MPGATRAAAIILDLKGNYVSESKRAARASKDLQAELKAAGVGFGAVTAAVGSGVAALISLQNEIVGTIDQVHTLAAASGLSAETVSGLRLAAKATGKQLEDLVPKKLAKNMLSAQRGAADMRDAFKQAGVEIETSAGELRKADDVYRELIDSLTGMENKTLAAGLAAQTMGNQGRQLLSAFSDSSDLQRFIDQSERFGYRTGPDAAKAMEKWQKATAQWSLAMETVKQLIADIFGPALANAMQAASGFMVFWAELTRGILVEIFGRFQMFFDSLGALMEGRFKDAGLKMAELMTPDHGMLLRVWGKAAATARDFIRSQGPLGGGGGGGGGGGDDDDGKGDKPVPVVDIPGNAAMREANAAMLTQLSDLHSGMVSAIKDLPTSMSLGGLSSGPVGMVAGLAIGAANLLTDIDDKARQLLRGIITGPDQIGEAVENLLTRVLPNMLGRLPEFLGGLLIRMPTAIARGIVEGIPKIVWSLAKAIGQEITKALNFLKGDTAQKIRTQKALEERGLGGVGKFGIIGLNIATALHKDKKQGKNQFEDDVVGKRAFGERVMHDGLRMVHQGEEIVPAHEQRARMSGAPIVINIGSLYPRDMQDFIRQIEAHLGPYGGGSTLNPTGS